MRPLPVRRLYDEYGVDHHALDDAVKGAIEDATPDEDADGIAEKFLDALAPIFEKLAKDAFEAGRKAALSAPPGAS